MLPLELVRMSGHSPLPIFPDSESAETMPDTVSGSSLEIFPKDVFAVMLKPASSGTYARMPPNEVFSAMLLHIADRPDAATSMEPF